MANRYWVGGTANWDGTAGTKWATTDGGAGGAAIPTSSDDVFFTAASGAVTVTIATGNTGAKSITCTGFAGALSGSAGMTVAGSVTLVAGMTFNAASTFTITGSGTLTNAGKNFQALTIIGAGITVTLGDAVSVFGALSITQGTFTTNNYSVTASSLSSSTSNVRTINLGSSTVTLSGTTPVNFTTSTGLTFNAGTSSLVFTSTGTQNVLNGTTAITFYDVFCGSTAATGGTIFSSTSPLTFNNLTCTAMSTVGLRQVLLGCPATINGTLSTTGTAGNRRVWFQGSTYGIAQTLTINSTPSLTDADFRDIYVIGTAAPISGTRIGDLRGCRGITFDAPKTVYWVTAAGGSWSGNNWAATSGGGASTDNFPLAQDTAVIENTGLNTSATVTIDAAFAYVGAIDMSTRSNAMTLTNGNATTSVYGDWKNGAGTTNTNSNTYAFSGRNTQTITSAGKTFSNITVDTYGGTVELADALNIGSNTLTVTNGTFDTKNYNLTVNSLSSSNTNVRTINFGSSTVTLGATSALSIVTTNLTFNAGTSSIICPIGVAGVSFNAGSGLSFYDVSFTAGTTSAITHIISGQNTFNNLSVTGTSSAGVRGISFNANQTINGTLTCAGATAVRRVFVRSDTLGTTRTLTVNSLSAQDCDFRDITMAGAAAGSSPVRAGDCGGNTGITFPAPKTVYWNLAGTQNWSATAWCTASGGSPDINQFPLAQDTAVFDDAGAAGTINIQAAWNIGTVDASARTTAMTLQPGTTTGTTIYGNWLYGSGVASSNQVNAIIFAGRGTQTITSNGVTFGCPINIDCVTGTVQLADAITLDATRTLFLFTGTFDAVTYNVTAGGVTFGGGTKTLKMGSGTWTLSGTNANVWDCLVSGLTFYKGTANIVLSSTSTSPRSFLGVGLSYNKLTIGGATGTSTTTITGNNQFTELASTKTVAHTIALGTTAQTVGAWTVTGTVGNVVTLTGTGTSHILAGACTSGIDYLAMGSIGFATVSPGEFYAGANSTGTAVAPVYRTAKPADDTRYWVGGTGNWSSTARWSASSGGASGATLPRSHDDVVFNSASNATAYTVTVDAVTGGIRTKSLTIAGPASGNVTLAGTALINGIHGDVTLPATGLTRTYTGAITLTGSTTGKTFTTNGVTIASNGSAINGVGCGWSLGSALNDGGAGSTWNIRNGEFDTAGYAVTLGAFASAEQGNTRTITFGSSTISIQNLPSGFTNSIGLTLNAGTSQINCSTNSIFNGGGLSFYNVSFTNTSAGTQTINGANTFNNLSVTGITSAGLKEISLSANQTINGTLTLSAGTNATMRTFVRSNTIGTTRTLTCAAVSATDVDFRDITIAGAAAPVSGTRLGDCKGNSGITFDAPKTVYYRNTAGNWGATTWSFTNNGTADVTAFPLAQDTAVFPSSPVPYPSSGATCTSTVSYNIGTIDMSARTSNTMTLATSTSTPQIYGNWINGTGTTLSGTGAMTFAGRGTQTITSAGVTFLQRFFIDTPSGSVTLQDAFVCSSTSNFQLDAGTFDANGYSVTLSSASSAVSSSNTNTRTIAVGSGTWTIVGSGTAWQTSTATNLTVTGTGTISLTSASAKTFAGGGISYSGITLNQGGAGTLTLAGNNTFANISNTYKATGATTIAMGTTTQTVANFTASGEAGRVLTIQGTSASSPATLVFSGSGQATTPTTDYLTITGVRAYNLDTTWYAGANSTNNGSLGWYFEAAGGGAISVFIIEAATASDAQSSIATLNIGVSESITAADAQAAGLTYLGTLSESATAADLVAAIRVFLADVSESATSTDLLSSALTFAASVSELTTAADATAVSSHILLSSVTEAAQMADSLSGGLFYLSSITEATTAQDVAAAVLIFTRSVSEASTASEVSAAVAAFNAAVPESVTGSDVARALLTFGGAIAETLTALDEAVAARILRPAVAETATASEAETTVYTANPAISETTQITDAAQVVASTFSAASAEAASLLDTAQGANTGTSTLSESATASETTSTAFNPSTQISEAAQQSDSTSAVAAFYAQATELAAATDTSAVAPSVFSAVALAAAEAAESFNPAGSVYNVALPIEGAGITDSLVGAFLWNDIDDTQIPNWGTINNTQTPTWAAVDDNQTPNWQNNTNSQGSGWVQVNTDDTPNWQPTINP